MSVVVVALFATGILGGKDETVQTSAGGGTQSDTGVSDVTEQPEMTSSPALEPTESPVENVGEAVMVSHTVKKDYFEKAKLSREQTRAKSKETLAQLVNNENVTDEQKQKVKDKNMNVTDISEKEIATENQLAMDGFNEAFVIILDDSVDVVVNSQNLTDQKIAQIKDIVKQKSGFEENKITIFSVYTEADNSDNVFSEENEDETILKSITETKNHFKETKQSTLIQMLNSKNATDTQKESAMNDMIKIIEISEKETAVENLLPAKGFYESVVTIMEDDVNVVVNVHELPERQIAQIEDIVKSKTKYPADKIIISPVDQN